jgi:DNA repair protein RecN (Recombination protein N)
MLRHIHIHNFAIVDELELDLSSGMTVLTGETGAGKSILLDALGLALGDRADTGAIRAGVDRAEVSVDFNITEHQQAQTWLHDHELDDEDLCLIRRTVNRDGRSKGYINGRPVPMQMLRELGEQLVDIHGQHEHQSLLKRDVQRQALDDYASAHSATNSTSHEKLVSDTAEHFLQWQQLTQTLAELQASREQRDDRLELLRYQVNELRELDFTNDEYANLETEHARLANQNQLREGGEQVLQALSGDDQNTLTDMVEKCSVDMQQLLSIDPALANVCETLQGAAIQSREAAVELRNYLDGLSNNPEQLQTLNERLGYIHDLARKHRLVPKELPVLHEQLETELSTLEKADIQLEAITSDICEVEKSYQQSASKLSTSRQQSAKKLAAAVTENMHQLGMPHGIFEIALELIEGLSIHGLERAEYRVTTNPGQPIQALAKVASGGELARISLAIQVIAAGSGNIPTLVFDEVDVGIGGGIAEVVGRLLKNLSDNRQVLCVTHQPQVASLAHQHLQVSKQSEKQKTITDVSPISEQDRIDEIARMLGGLEITEQTLSHAQEMIERGQQPLT